MKKALQIIKNVLVWIVIIFAAVVMIFTIVSKILQLLDDGQPHPITALRGLQLPVGELDTALEYLLQEEYIRQEDGLLRKL